MIALAIAKKNFIEFFRNMKSNLIVVILPIIFFVIFGFIFNNDSNISFPIATFNEESFTNQNGIILAQVKELKNTDNAPLFQISKFTDLDEAKDSIRANTNILLLSVNDSGKLSVLGDDRNVYFNSAVGIINNVVDAVYQIDSNLIEKININVSDDKTFSAFDMLVPGLIVYGLLIMIPHNAGQFTELVAKKKIFRLFLSYATGKDIIFGYIISQTLLSLLQTFLLFVVAQMFGFKTDANVLEILVIAIPTNLFIVGTSLLIGGLVKNVDNATNLGTMISVVLGFLSGSFIVGIENIMRIDEFMGHQTSFNQIFPSTSATQAWTQMLLFSKHLGDLSFELVGLTSFSLVILIAGIIIYNKNQLNRID